MIDGSICRARLGGDAAPAGLRGGAVGIGGVEHLVGEESAVEIDVQAEVVDEKLEDL